MKVNFIKIIKNAWQITWYNKYLWWFGAIIFSSGISFNYTFPFSENYKNKLEFNKIKIETIKNFKIAFFHYETIIIFFVLLFFLFIFFLWILSAIGQGSLIGSLYKLARGEEVSFKKGLREGLHFGVPLFLLGLLFFFFNLILILILFLPVTWLIFSAQFIAGFLLFFLALLILFPFIIFFNFLKIIASFYIVIGKVKIIDSLNLAYIFLKKQWKNVLVLALLLMIIRAVFSFILLAPFLIFFFLILLFSIGLGHIIAIQYSILIIVSISLILILLLFNGILNTFSYASWFYLFVETADKQSPDDFSEKDLNSDLEKDVLLPEKKAPVISKK